MSSNRVFLETFGCQMNILDSELVQNQLTGLGYEFVQNPEEAQVVLFNTCSVRDLSEQKVLSRLGIVKKRKQAGESLIVGVLGCMAERAHETLAKEASTVDFVVGPNKLAQVASLLKEAQTHTLKNPFAISHFHARKGKDWVEPESGDETESLESLDQHRGHHATHKAQAYVRITRGCNKFCSFCVVPKTRGPEAHRNPQGIVDEVKRLVDQGVIEVTLLGQTINHYDYVDQRGQKTNFAQLLYRIHEEVRDLKRLRFLTSYPRDFTDEALDVMAACDRISKYLHIPAQSGSNRILQRMNRGYTKEGYLELIAKAKGKMPHISIMGDMIVGFPTETEEDFLESLDLIKEVEYKNIFVFKYSPRPGTVSGKRDEDDVPKALKEERNHRMLALQKEISLKAHQALLGQTLEVLIESPAKVVIGSKHQTEGHLRLLGRTPGDHIVTFDGPENLIGSLAHIEIQKATPLALGGRLLSLNS